MKVRRKYDKEFKQMAVRLLATGKSAKEVGKDLGIAADLVNRWRRESVKYGSGSFSGNGNANLSDEEKEIVELKKQLLEKELECEILKKAVSIFSKSDRKSLLL